MFYDNLDVLCAERGITVSRLLEILNLSRSSASRWKTKGYLPSRETAKKIADYFGISVQELLSIEKAPTVSDERVRDAVKNLSPEQIAEVLDYIDWLKSKRK